MNHKEAMDSCDKKMLRHLVKHLSDLLDIGALEVLPRPKDKRSSLLKSRWLMTYKMFDTINKMETS